MKTYATIPQIKAAARSRLPGKLNLTVTATIMYWTIYIIVLQMVLPASTGNAFLLMYYLLAFFLTQLLMGLFISGTAYMYMNIIYGQPAKLSDFFHGFKEQPNKAILLQLVMVLIGMAISIPVFLYEMFAGAYYTLPGELLLTALASVISFLVRLIYSQSFYLLQDFPERSVPELLKGSARLMRGHFLRLIRLTISFIPMFLLGIVTFFVPLLWFNSYYQAALAAFYQDLVSSGHQPTPGQS